MEVDIRIIVTKIIIN